jgi:hypothetical protein
LSCSFEEVVSVSEMDSGGELPLPDFPYDIPQSLGETYAADGAQNMCLSFCIFIWYGERWRPWGSVMVCAPSPEEIAAHVQWIIDRAAQLGFQCQAQQGDCPAA